MAGFLGIIGGHLAGLVRIHGREHRASFWIYVAVVMGFTFVACFAIIAPAIADTVMRIEQFAAEHPDQVTVQSSAGQFSITVHGYHPELLPDFAGIAPGMLALCAVVILLLAAAVVRRLHDCGRRGTWGLLPVPFLASGLLIMPRLLGAPDFDPGLFALLFFNNAVYLAALGWLVYLLAGPGSKGDNRFGPEPPAPFAKRPLRR